MPELGRMTIGEAAMTGLAPMPHDSGTMCGKRGPSVDGGRRSMSQSGAETRSSNLSKNVASPTSSP